MLVWNRIILLPMFFFRSRVQPHPLVTYIHTHLSVYHPPPSEVAYVIPPIQPIYTRPSTFVVTNPTPLLASIMFIINCTPPYPYLYLWPPLTPYIQLFLHLRLFLSALMWSETKMNRLCIIFERIRRVSQQSEGSYSRKASRTITGNRYREIEIRLLLIA